MAETAFRVIIAGTRTFNNYELLQSTLDWLLKEKKDAHSIVIISGKARGADSLGERYAKENGYLIDDKPAEWDKYGKAAGYIRNEEMAKVAEACVVFWDGKSRGSKHMIDLAKKYNLKLKVVVYEGV